MIQKIIICILFLASGFVLGIGFYSKFIYECHFKGAYIKGYRYGYEAGENGYPNTHDMDSQIYYEHFDSFEWDYTGKTLGDSVNNYDAD